MNDHCYICGEKIAPFLIDGKRYCCEHWMATGHYVNIKLTERNEVVENGENQSSEECGKS